MHPVVDIGSRHAQVIDLHLDCMTAFSYPGRKLPLSVEAGMIACTDQLLQSDSKHTQRFVLLRGC